MSRLFVAVLVAFLAGSAYAADDFQIIVNVSNPSRAMTREGISALFLKKVVRWEQGGAVSPVDQLDSAPVRAAFSREILGKSVSAVASYWQQQIFSGREVPPPQKSGDVAVIEFVKANPGAVGYVSARAVTSEVQVLAVKK